MADLPFFPLATDAFLADCVHLDDAETGRYFLLLVALWRAPQQRLPNDDEWLARKFRRDAARVRSELRPLVNEFCQCDGNWITQKRISREYKRAVKQMDQRRDAANARWRKEKPSYERNAGSHGFRNAPTLIPTPIHHESLTTDSTDAAGDPAPDQTAPGRAPAKPETSQQRLARLALAHRLKTMRKAEP